MGGDIAVYGGYIDDEEKLMRSVSGGIATALAERMVEEGGYVAGVAYSDDFYRAEYIITKERGDLERLKGSKYIEVDKKDIYSRVKRLLDGGERVLFIGLPCAVAGLYAFLGARVERLLTCELVCHGPTIARVHEEYIAYLEKKHRSKIVAFSVRHKKKDWFSACLCAKFKNGKTFEKPFYNTEYGFAFSIFGREACYRCPFKGDNRRGDIMVGDFWGATERDMFWNEKGVSVVFAETEKGNRALMNLQSIRLFPTTFERAVAHNPAVVHSRRKDPKCEKFEKWFQKRGLLYAARRCIGVKRRIKRIIDKYIPRKIVLWIKRMVKGG